MRQIIYDVAVTLDGFIAREDGSFDGFLQEGPHADDYLQRLQSYETVLMGRKTYEVGYAFGLKPGQRAYPHMEHLIVSNTLDFDSTEVEILSSEVMARVRALKSSSGGPIYFCGGGDIAGQLVGEGLIDQLVLKINPVCFGRGIPLLGAWDQTLPAELVESKTYDNGVLCSRYALRGPS